MHVEVDHAVREENGSTVFEGASALNDECRTPLYCGSHLSRLDSTLMFMNVLPHSQSVKCMHYGIAAFVLEGDIAVAKLIANQRGSGHSHGEPPWIEIRRHRRL